MIGEARASVTRRVKAIGARTSRPEEAFISSGFATAQLLDVTTTHIGLSQGRQELNGVAAWIIRTMENWRSTPSSCRWWRGLVAFLLVFGRRRAGIWNAYLIGCWITTLRWSTICIAF